MNEYTANCHCSLIRIYNGKFVYKEDIQEMINAIGFLLSEYETSRPNTCCCNNKIEKKLDYARRVMDLLKTFIDAANT